MISRLSKTSYKSAFLILSFRFLLLRTVSFRFVSFRFVSFRFVSFLKRFLHVNIRKTCTVFMCIANVHVSNTHSRSNTQIFLGKVTELCRGGSRPKFKGGQLGEGAPKTQ